MRRLIVFFLLILGGCVSPGERAREAEANGYARGYRQAVQEQYWIIQNLQRGAEKPAAETPEIP